jgi:hypothetical protein
MTLDKLRMHQFLGAIFMICMIWVFVLGLAIYLLTLYIAYLSSFFAVLLSLIFPFLSQLYWISHIWSATGVFFNFLTLMCLGWFGLVVTMIFLAVIGDSYAYARR